MCDRGREKGVAIGDGVRDCDGSEMWQTSTVTRNP